MWRKWLNGESGAPFPSYQYRHMLKHALKDCLCLIRVMWSEASNGGCDAIVEPPDKPSSIPHAVCLKCSNNVEGCIHLNIDMIGWCWWVREVLYKTQTHLTTALLTQHLCLLWLLQRPHNSNCCMATADWPCRVFQRPPLHGVSGKMHLENT